MIAHRLYTSCKYFCVTSGMEIVVPWRSKAFEGVRKRSNASGGGLREACARRSRGVRAARARRSRRVREAFAMLSVIIAVRKPSRALISDRKHGERRSVDSHFTQWCQVMLLCPRLQVIEFNIFDFRHLWHSTAIECDRLRSLSV